MLVSLAALALAGLACMPAGAGAFSASQARYLKAANQGVKQTQPLVEPGPSLVQLGDGRVEPGFALGSRAALRGARRAADRGSIQPPPPSAQPVRLGSPAVSQSARSSRFPGFGPRPRQHEPGKTTWFDDNGWWGLAFLDAYRATGNGRYLTDAEIAQNFISVSGWDNTPGRPGGIWWNTNHSFYAGESLASGTLLSARLYAITHDKHYLDDATKFIDWANVWLVDPHNGAVRPPAQARHLRQGDDRGLRHRERYVPRAGGRRRAKALSANPDEAAKLEAAGTPVPLRARRRRRTTTRRSPPRRCRT